MKNKLLRHQVHKNFNDKNNLTYEKLTNVFLEDNESISRLELRVKIQKCVNLLSRKYNLNENVILEILKIEYLVLNLVVNDGGEVSIIHTWINPSKVTIDNATNLSNNINDHLEKLVQGKAKKNFYKDQAVTGDKYVTPDCFAYLKYGRTKFKTLSENNIEDFFTNKYDQYEGYSLGWDKIPDIFEDKFSKIPIHIQKKYEPLDLTLLSRK